MEYNPRAELRYFGKKLAFSFLYILVPFAHLGVFFGISSEGLSTTNWKAAKNLSLAVGVGELATLFFYRWFEIVMPIVPLAVAFDIGLLAYLLTAQIESSSNTNYSVRWNWWN